MAEFTQGTPQAQPGPSYIGLSQGIRSSGDSSIATLFEGLAESLKQGVAVVDSAIKDNIEQDVFDAVDSVQAEFGIPEATDLQSNAGEASFRTSPVGVQRGVEQLQTLQSAYAAGNLKESHYWARMNSMVRQLRGKYPGYRAEIDQLVSSVTGARPANALRQALFSEWSQEAKGQGLSEEDKFVNANQDTIPADYFQRKGTANAYTLDEIRAYSAQKNKMMFELDSRSKQMNVESSAGELTTKRVIKNFQADTSSIVQSVLGDVNAGLGKTFKETTDALGEFQRRAERGDPASAQELEQFKMAIPQMAVELEQQLWRHHAADKNYSEHMTPSDVKASIDLAMRPIRILEQALADENFGLLKTVSAVVDAMGVDSQKEVLDRIPIMRRIDAFREIVGADGLSMLLTMDDVTRSSLTEALHKNSTIGMGLGEEEVTQAFETAIAADAPAQFYDLMSKWNKWADAAIAGSIPSESFENFINGMFGQNADQIMNNPKYFKNDESRFKYFAQVASPETSRKMIQLRDAGHDQAWRTYQTWVARNFTTLFMSKVGTVQSLVTDPQSRFDVKWNEQTSQFGVDLRLFGDTTVRHPLTPAVNELNRALAVIRPIIQDGGGETGNEILHLLTEMGYDPSADRRDPFLTAMWNAITGNKKGKEDGNTAE